MVLRAAASAVAAIHRLQFGAVVVVADAVHQGGDPLGIELQGRHLLPQPPAALPVGAHELGVHQLAGEQEHQLLLLAGRKAHRLWRTWLRSARLRLAVFIVVASGPVHRSCPVDLIPALGRRGGGGQPSLQESL
jgi:hypothetical protein